MPHSILLCPLSETLTVQHSYRRASNWRDADGVLARGCRYTTISIQISRGEFLRQCAYKLREAAVILPV